MIRIGQSIVSPPEGPLWILGYISYIQRGWISREYENKGKVKSTRQERVQENTAPFVAKFTSVGYV